MGLTKAGGAALPYHPKSIILAAALRLLQLQLHAPGLLFWLAGAIWAEK
jgi:hypothetical protein